MRLSGREKILEAHHGKVKYSIRSFCLQRSELNRLMNTDSVIRDKRPFVSWSENRK